MTTVSRVTRQDAATRLEVSEATVDRMIRRGELQVEKEPQGNRYKVWVLLDDTEQIPDDNSGENTVYADDSKAEKSVYTVKTSAENGVQSHEDGVYTGEDELTALRTENRSLRELADYHREQLRDAEWRYRELMERLKLSQETMATLTKALPAAVDGNNAPARRSWWSFGRGKR